MTCEEREADPWHPYQGDRRNPVSSASLIDAVFLLGPAEASSLIITDSADMLCQPSLVFLISYKHHMVPHI